MSKNKIEQGMSNYIKIKRRDGTFTFVRDVLGASTDPPLTDHEVLINELYRELNSAGFDFDKFLPRIIDVLDKSKNEDFVRGVCWAIDTIRKNIKKRFCQDRPDKAVKELGSDAIQLK